MKSSNETAQPGEGQKVQPQGAVKEELHSAWLDFIRYCRKLGYGEIERVRIQDGLPVMAEVTTKKVKFGP